ncbi:putative leucine-rich repeat-containing protein DDB_G0290503 [Chironomus tepperi]|uniref:putative leucine-rich repeat-containing protein DDB_G0290503 n=1 Tax=Chironomus tepperi TaxID=113505 RepID=UPI00391F8494
MSLNININKMSYNGRSYAENAEAEKRKINRILSVREQSSELAQKLLKKTRSAKEQELKKLQQIKEKELGEWKRKTQYEIQKQIDNCVGHFGDAHIAAVDASCEEDEFLCDKKDEQELMAAMRGRVAMLQVQRERERELEKKLLKKKRQQQKTVGIQADFLTQRRFSENLINKQKNAETDVSEEEGNDSVFIVKPNPHKHSEQYNPQNYTSNSVDSSNNCDSEIESIAELEEDESVKNNDESEVEFNQISNLLRQRLHNNQDSIKINKVIDVGSSDSESISYNVEFPKKVTIRTSPIKKKKGILKNSPAKINNSKKQNSPVKSKKVQASDNRVRYVDFGNKYETTYVPDKNLIVRNEKSKTNARQNAQIQTDDDAITKKINEDILKQLTDLRSQEALEKEKIRRDYEKLRLELDELSKQEQEAKSRTNMQTNISRDQLLRKEEIRQRKMNEAAENAMKKNIITCPPVDRNEKSMRQKLCEINVGAPSLSSREETQKDKSATIKLTRSNSEINNLVKVEKLKDLLEKINHQKRLLLNEIEKSDEIPGPDLEKVMDCIKKLEQEKAALNSDNKIDESKLEKINELNEREKKIQEREKRLEKNLRELFKKQQEKEVVKSSSSNSEHTISDDSSSSKEKNSKKVVQPPVEIIIKVQQPKSPHKKSRKSYRCVDTLSREPGKIYPKTPIKKKKSIDSDIEIVENESQKLPEQEKSQQETQTSPIVLEAPKPILKNSQLKQISIPPKSMSKESSKSSKVSSVPKQQQTADSEDFSVSTVYHELPPQINLISGKESQRKLNPMLMDYITRVLGMNKNIGSQLNINVSSVTTPGSSTINTTGNRSSNDELSFDQDRMNRLQKFIDDNHSFISEINESLDRVEVKKKQDKDQEKIVEGIWREILSKKKQGKTTSESQSKVSSNAKKSKPTAPSNVSSKKVNQPPQLPQKESKKSTTESSQKTVRSQPVPTKPPKITQEDMADVSKYLESQMLNNYSEYTANCQRRIAELTQMMEKVRQEKLKLIENSLSSNELNNFTEYKDIVQTTATKENVNGSTETKDSPSNRDDPPSEEINNILQYQTRPFGVSKDSGISGISRPVTSSDFRDTPPDRVTSEDNNNNNNNNLFQPILKDIPKLPRMKITTSDGETQTIKDVSVLIKQQQDEKNQKKQRPPLSLKSPQFEKQQHEPHELSTIAEIETPTASKVNIQDEISGVGAFHSFPNFEEYAKNNQKNASEIRQAEISFPDMNDLMKALPDLNIKTFVEQDGLSLVNFTKDDEKEIPSTDSSLMDIMGELKKRNLIESSFQIYYEDENKDNLLEAGFERDDKTTPTTTNQMTEPISPRRKKPAQSRIIMKTPENTGRTEVIHTPIKEKHHGPHIHDDKSLNSNDTLSGIQEIEKDFLTHGMAWAASTMKRTEESKKQAVSSSSSDNQDSIKINFEFDTSTSSSDGKPLNLRDFLRRELLTRSRNDPYLSDDSSLSSKFVKSLLKASHSSSSTSSNDPKSDSSQNAKLRTSTPVRMSSENLAKTAGSSHVFNGADSVSTVKDSDSSKDKSDKEKS